MRSLRAVNAQYFRRLHSQTRAYLVGEQNLPHSRPPRRDPRTDRDQPVARLAATCRDTSSNTSLFHEMLHIAHPTQHINGRRYNHTAAFKRDERKFAYYEEAERWIERNVRRLKKEAKRK